MITLPPAFAAINKQKKATPTIIISLEDSELKSVKTTEADWTANISESNVDYVVQSGSVLLTFPLWICDSSVNKIYSTRIDGTLISSFATSVFDASAINISGVSYDPVTNTLWLCDGFTDKIYNTETDGTLISSFLTSVFDAGAITVSGVSYDPVTNTLWICDFTTDKIYNTETDGTLISSFLTSVFDVLATSPTGVSFAANNTLWICDFTTDKIYNTETDGTLISSFLTSVFDVLATSPTGVSFAANNTLWICDSGTDKIYNTQINGGLISSFLTSVFDAFATSPQGLTTEGYYSTGNITVELDLGSTPTVIGEWQIADTTPDDSTLTYTAEGSATGAWGGEEVPLGAIEDGDVIADLFRYYRVTANFAPNTDKDETPVLQSITASFLTEVRFTDTKGFGLNAIVDGIASLTTQIDFFKESTIGQISLTVPFNQELSTYFSIPRKNRLVRILQGFKDLSEGDFIPYYYGIIGNAPINTGEKITINVDDYTATWKKPVPAKWENTGDDVEWVNVHHIDVMLDIFQNHLDVRDSFIIYPTFQTVKDALPGLKVSRKITGKSEDAYKLLDELRRLISCFFIPQPDGKISIKLFDPTDAAVVTLTDDDFITGPGLSYDPNYKELINHLLTYYGWDGVGSNLDAYSSLDDFPNPTSIEAWKEEKFKTIKDNWTASTEVTQVTDRRDIIDGVFGNAPAILTGNISRKLLWLEVGDMVNITIDRYPKNGGFGIENKKFLLIRRNYHYENANIGVTFLEI